MKTRGGQKKHWAEAARVWAWYREIRRRCDWTDYRLDYEFAWTEKGEKVRDDNKSDHPRTFEWIRKKARQPKGRDQRWRDMEDLVSTVDTHPFFAGTAALYRSNLWDLIQSPLMSPDDVDARLKQLLMMYDLVRVNPIHHPHINRMVMKYGEPSVFDRTLRLSLKRMGTMSGATLVWLMYLLAEPAQNWKFRESLELIADQQLDYLFEHYFAADYHLTFYSNAIHTMQHARLDMRTGHPPSGYGFIETLSTWPVLPREVVATITEEQLFTIHR